MIQFLAIGALCGIPPSAYLRAADEIEKVIIVRIINEAQKIRQQYSEELANMIIGELAQAWNRGQRRRG